MENGKDEAVGLLVAIVQYMEINAEKPMQYFCGVEWFIEVTIVTTMAKPNHTDKVKENRSRLTSKIRTTKVRITFYK